MIYTRDVNETRLFLFFYEQDYKVLKSPSPPPEPELVEQVMSDHFTVNQLFSLYKQVTWQGMNE